MDLATSPRLYAYTGGKPFDATKPTIVFLHGAQHDHSVWILQSRYLAHHGYSVLALDLPGHLRSDGPPLESVEAIADRLADVLRSANVARMIVVGHSMGSLIALELAKRLPVAVAGIALVATAFPMRVADPLLNATRDAPAEAPPDDIGRVAEALATARGTIRVVRQNLGWAALYNAIAIPAAAFGFVTPLLAAVGMSLSSLVVVLNAVRLARPAPVVIATKRTGQSSVR